MLKRISPQQAELGMFIHKLEGSWLKHPFWKSKFLLQDHDTLEDLRDSEIDAVVIDVSRGRDAGARRETARPHHAPSPNPALPGRKRGLAAVAPPPIDYRSTSPQSMAREFGMAGKVASRGRRVVSKVFLEARLGKTIEAETVEPLIDDIFASIQRNPHAFNGLMRCKRDNEYIYRHALACSALMISLARQLRLPPSQIREAGIAGLLFDVGVNHLPIDLEGTGGDYRRLPPHIREQHTRLGYDFLIAGGTPEQIAIVALQHHERIDGSGYPNQLRGNEISLYSRMAAVCDAYDILVSGGPDTPALDPGGAVQRLNELATKFDPAILQAFIECIGVWPIGAMVQLRSGRMAMVIDQDQADLKRPRVRAFYSLSEGKRIGPTDIALSQCYGEDEITGAADLSHFEPEDLAELRQRLFSAAAKAAG